MKPNETKSLYDKVLFESDRTCCYCRDHARPVQIHHVDSDRSNNERSNLVVLCSSCHELVHGNVPFTQNFSKGQVRLYDESWRELCAVRLLPKSGQSEMVEYCQEVLLEVSLACHAWKNDYIDIYPDHFRNKLDESKDVWDLLINSGKHEDSVEEWTQYRSLFAESIEKVDDRLRTILSCHGEAIPANLKTLIMRTLRKLSVEGIVFEKFGPAGTSVTSRIQGVLGALANLARTAGAQTSASPVVEWKE